MRVVEDSEEGRSQFFGGRSKDPSHAESRLLLRKLYLASRSELPIETAAFERVSTRQAEGNADSLRGSSGGGSLRNWSWIRHIRNLVVTGPAVGNVGPLWRCSRLKKFKIAPDEERWRACKIVHRVVGITAFGAELPRRGVTAAGRHRCATEMNSDWKRTFPPTILIVVLAGSRGSLREAGGIWKNWRKVEEEITLLPQVSGKSLTKELGTRKINSEARSNSRCHPRGPRISRSAKKHENGGARHPGEIAEELKNQERLRSDAVISVLSECMGERRAEELANWRWPRQTIPIVILAGSRGFLGGDIRSQLEFAHDSDDAAE
ncbi:hypothetical protein C8R43DRAFT_943391 [Mycena crocata]|nr:hypothetical protein C8R43DRAFT_943391 [Mycena crocata]